MAKRSAEEMKGPTKRRCTVQATMFKFFQPGDGAQGASSHKLSEVAEETPRSYGIHTYTDEEISKAKGLNQEFRKFRNEKAADLCRDSSVRGKLQNKVAIQGAIYVHFMDAA